MNIEDKAYAFAAAFQGVKPKGSTPTVKYVKKLTVKGRRVVGRYRHYRIFRWVIWDRIWVKTPFGQWPILCHEMSHALDARYGKRADEAKADACGVASLEAGEPK